MFSGPLVAMTDLPLLWRTIIVTYNTIGAPQQRIARVQTELR